VPGRFGCPGTGNPRGADRGSIEPCPGQSSASQDIPIRKSPGLQKTVPRDLSKAEFDRLALSAGKTAADLLDGSPDFRPRLASRI
jgi:hypothetical protein